MLKIIERSQVLYKLDSEGNGTEFVYDDLFRCGGLIPTTFSKRQVSICVRLCGIILYFVLH